MNRKTVGIGVAIALLAGTAGAQTFVGSFQTDDGPNWTTNPPVLSGIEAAALIFGGSPSDYRVSTNPSLDPNTITDTAWYTIIGIAGGHEFASNFSQDLGGPGYGAPGWVPNDDISTYVDDNAIGPDFTNYVWLVPAPSGVALLGMGGLLAARRRR